MNKVACTRCKRNVSYHFTYTTNAGTFCERCFFSNRTKTVKCLKCNKPVLKVSEEAVIAAVCSSCIQKNPKLRTKRLLPLTK